MRKIVTTNRFELFAVMVATAVALCLLALVAAQPAEAAFPGKNGKIAFERGLRIWVKKPSLGAAETKLRDDGVADKQPAFSPDGSRVAFMRSNEIYVTNADGSGTPRRLTNNLLLDSNPAWSHDGTRIAFQRRGSDNQYNIWTMNSDGTGQVQRTSDGGNTEPAWSSPLPGAPDGKIVYRHNAAELWTMKPNGSGRAELIFECPTDNGICDTSIGIPTFSPDGTMIAFDYSGDIYWTTTAGGGNSTPILRGSGVDGEYPGDEQRATWSPDGAKIAFMHNGNVPGGAYDIYMANANGSSTQAIRLTNASGGGANPNWQPIPVCTKRVNANNAPLTGTAGKDVLCGDNRNNTINGAGSNDIILGNGGNDRLIGAGGNDTMNGGPGTDTVLYPGSAAVRANLTTGFATGVGSDVLLGIENLTGSGANDRLTGSSAANALVGGNGADTLSGLGGADKLNSRDGVNGNDTLNGGGGTDKCVTDVKERSITSCP